MKHYFILFSLLIAQIAFAQKPQNLDFELIEVDKFTALSSFGSNEYTVSIDSTHVKSGKYSARIEQNGKTNYKAISFGIPANYQGSKIKLTGFIKTEGVDAGYAGLWLRVDPQLGFDNMANRGIRKTTDWAEYEIEMDLQSNRAERIVFGALLSGTGKMWVDDLKITIDGLELDQVPERTEPVIKPDTTFIKGSKVVFPELDKRFISDLDLLGRVWGFLKYHHPTVAGGNYHWDFELFRVLPKYLEAKKKDRQQVLTDWIDQLGEVPPCEDCEQVSDDAFLKPDHKWMSSSMVGKALKQKLEHILENRHQGPNFYIKLYPGVRNPEFRNEDTYENMTYPDKGFRLLTLYRYWNMIHYFFPYRHLTDKNWNDVLAEYIPKFINAKNEYEFEEATIQIIGDVKDTHANLWGGKDVIENRRGTHYPPVHVNFVEDQLVIVDFYNEEHRESLGLKIGDVITHINGQQVTDMVRERQKNYPASNQPTRMRDVALNMLRSNQAKSTITYNRGGSEMEMELPLFLRQDLKIYGWYRPDPDGKSFRWLEDNIGYVTLKNIKAEDIPQIKEQFGDARGIVIDIRNYPSTFVPFSLGGFFINEPTGFAKFTRGSINNPGEFRMGQPVQMQPDQDMFKGKVVVLVNEISQSQAEYTTMAFQAGMNTTVVGSTTAGADGNISRILLPGGMSTMISGIGVYYPDGRETQRIGIVPDVEVRPTIKGIREGRDELLEKAIEIIKN